MRKLITLVLCSLLWLSVASAFADSKGPNIMKIHDATTIPGDANCDGAVNVMDVITTANFILGNNPQPFCFDNADVNFDGFVNLMDLISTVTIILSGGNLPTVSTTTPAMITDSSATSGGIVTNDGGIAVTARGVVWSTVNNPTLQNNLGFTIDGTGVGEFLSQLSGLTPGTNYFVRAYATNAVGSNYGESLAFTTLPPGQVPLCMALDNCDLNFNSGGDAAWFGQTTTSYDGIHAAQSGAITHNQVSWMQTVVEGPGLLSFWWKVSSEANYDFLQFFINNELKASISGNVNWQEKQYILTQGENTIRWVYIKDGSISQGQDCGWVDQFVFIPLGLAELTTLPVTGITATTAISGGNITGDGGATVTARGIVWSTFENPSIENNQGYTTDGTGIGEFVSNLTNLQAETLYYVRAYATNSIGTSYGNQLSFTTAVQGIPTVTTTPETVIGNTWAISGGNVISDGGSPVIKRGVCWSINPAPTTSDSITNNGSGTGTYTSYLIGLTPNTTYYLRAYAINSNGTGYGDEISFITTSGTGFTCGGLISDIDGNIYNTVLINTQCWMKENLKTTTYSNGTSIPNVMDSNAWGNLTTGAYTWYNNDIGWKDSYGAFYNWYAVNNTNGLCPTGWHVPTFVEFLILPDYLGGQSIAGGKMKSTRTVPDPHPRWENPNTGATNESNWSGLPGGYRGSGGWFASLGNNGSWWSASETFSGEAPGCYLILESSSFLQYNFNKKQGFSVRCLRD